MFERQVQTAVAVVAALFSMGADCQTQSGGEASTSPTKRATEGSGGKEPTTDPFLYAPVSTTQQDAPKSTGTALPTDYASLKSEMGERANMAHLSPAFTEIRIRACDGQIQSLKSIVSAIRQAIDDDTMSDKLKSFYVRFINRCNGNHFCKFAAAQATSDAPDALREIMSRSLSYCDGEDAREAVMANEPGPKALVEWYALAPAGASLDVTPEFKEAAAKLLESDWEKSADRVAEALLHVDPKEAANLAKELLEMADGEKQRAMLTVEFGPHPHPALDALYLNGCQHADFASTYRCDHSGDRASGNAENHARSGELADVLEYVEHRTGTRKQVREGLETCVREKTTDERYTGLDCLKQLSRLDWEAARQFLKDFLETTRKELPSTHRVQLQTLSKFESHQAMVDWAAENGLVSAKKGRHELRGATTIEDLMRATGRKHSFDTETGRFPNYHDSLLLELATLDGAGLDDVEFQEIPPENHRQTDTPYTLHAFSNGIRYSTKARNLRDWYDVPTVLGLLNQLLKARDSELRYATVRSQDQMSHVLLGDRHGLIAAHRAGVLEIGGVDSARREGQAFEKKVLEGLRNSDP